MDFGLIFDRFWTIIFVTFALFVYLIFFVDGFLMDYGWKILKPTNTRFKHRAGPGQPRLSLSFSLFENESNCLLGQVRPKPTRNKDIKANNYEI